jgi:hypothetical protein
MASMNNSSAVNFLLSGQVPTTSSLLGAHARHLMGDPNNLLMGRGADIINSALLSAPDTIRMDNQNALVALQMEAMRRPLTQSELSVATTLLGSANAARLMPQPQLFALNDPRALQFGVAPLPFAAIPTGLSGMPGMVPTTAQSVNTGFVDPRFFNPSPQAQSFSDPRFFNPPPQAQSFSDPRFFNPSPQVQSFNDPRFFNPPPQVQSFNDPRFFNQAQQRTTVNAQPDPMQFLTGLVMSLVMFIGMLGSGQQQQAR